MGQPTNFSSEIKCTCCSVKLRVETNVIDSHTGTYCIYLNSFLLCNGGLYLDEDDKLHKKHFYHNEQLFTTNIFQHVLAYIREIEDSFRSVAKKKEKWTRLRRVKKMKL